MKTKFEIQFKEKNAEAGEIEKLVKEDLKVNGVKMNTVDTLEIFYQPEKTVVYYLAKLKDGTEVNSDAIAV